MPQSLATCKLCGFSVPWGDPIGKAFMEQHFKAEHPEEDLYQKPSKSP